MLEREQLIEMLVAHGDGNDFWFLHPTGAVEIVDNDGSTAESMPAPEGARYLIRSDQVANFIAQKGPDEAVKFLNSMIRLTIARPSPRNPLSALGSLAGRTVTKRMGV